MPINEGKKFENDFKKSCDSVPELFYYRFRDGTSSWSGGNDLTRFQATNICDAMAFYQYRLFLLELKSCLKKSLPLSNIKDSQIEGMTKAINVGSPNMFAGLLINFRDYEETYYMSIKQLNEFLNKKERKSIPIDYCRENCKKVKQELKKVRYGYYIKEFLDTFENKKI